MADNSASPSSSPSSSPFNSPSRSSKSPSNSPSRGKGRKRRDSKAALPDTDLSRRKPKPGSSPLVAEVTVPKDDTAKVTFKDGPEDVRSGSTRSRSRTSTEVARKPKVDRWNNLAQPEKEGLALLRKILSIPQAVFQRQLNSALADDHGKKRLMTAFSQPPCVSLLISRVCDRESAIEQNLSTSVVPQRRSMGLVMTKAPTTERDKGSTQMGELDEETAKDEAVRILKQEQTQIMMECRRAAQLLAGPLPALSEAAVAPFSTPVPMQYPHVITYYSLMQQGKGCSELDITHPLDILFDFLYVSPPLPKTHPTPSWFRVTNHLLRNYAVEVLMYISEHDAKLRTSVEGTSANIAKEQTLRRGRGRAHHCIQDCKEQFRAGLGKEKFGKMTLLSRMVSHLGTSSMEELIRGLLEAEANLPPGVSGIIDRKSLGKMLVKATLHGTSIAADASTRLLGLLMKGDVDIQSFLMEKDITSCLLNCVKKNDLPIASRAVHLVNVLLERVVPADSDDEGSEDGSAIDLDDAPGLIQCLIGPESPLLRFSAELDVKIRSQRSHLPCPASLCEQNDLPFPAASLGALDIELLHTLACLVKSLNERVDEFVISSGLLPTVVDMFFLWDNHSMLQTYVDDLFEEILSTEDHFDLCEQLLTECHLPQKIMEAYELFVPSHLSNEKPRSRDETITLIQNAFSIDLSDDTKPFAGYFGHLACFADYVTNCEEGEEWLSEIDGWKEFADNILEKVYSARRIQWNAPTRMGKVKLVAD